MFFLISCGNNFTIENIEALPKEEEYIKEKLDSNLVHGVFKLIQRGYHLKYPDIPLDENFIAIVFEVSIVERQGNCLDSIVYIHLNVYQHYDNKNYKGILNVDGYNVVIFDIGNFGDNYYNIDSLKQIPLDKFKPYPMDVIPSITYFVRNGELYYWGYD
jgi:hypothetical protein